MQPAPDTSCRLRPADHRIPLERLDLGTGRIEQDLNLLLNPIHLEALQANDFVPVVDWE